MRENITAEEVTARFKEVNAVNQGKELLERFK